MTIKLNMAICTVLEPNKNFMLTLHSNHTKQLAGSMGREPKHRNYPLTHNNRSATLTCVTGQMRVH